MAELFIDCHGEVRLGSEVVGTIQWAGPCAHYDAAGEWEKDAGDCCISCGGFLASSEAFEEVEEERDQLEGKQKKATKTIENLTRELQALRGAQAGADG